LQSLCQVGPMDAHTGTQRPLNASLPGPAGKSYHTRCIVRIGHFLASNDADKVSPSLVQILVHLW
jgi:hypothetical protein